MSDHIDISGVRLHLSQPDDSPSEWIGQREVLQQLLACWLVVDEKDLPLAPRLIGTPGIGKTSLGIAAGRTRKQDLYIYQCTADTRPEDLLVTPVLAEDGKIKYHASSLVTAMLRGGIHRRYVESIVAGIKIPANRDFRCAVTMNDDESTFEIPDYILSRLQPTLTLGHPKRDDELAILQYHLPFAELEMLNLTVDFLQQSHQLNLDFSTRDGINVLRYAMKRIAQDASHPVGKDKVWQEALINCLGAEAVDLNEAAKRRQGSLGGNTMPMGLGDFFFDSDDPLHPDFDDENDDEEESEDD
jgi:MoxR-like ATPase